MIIISGVIYPQPARYSVLIYVGNDYDWVNVLRSFYMQCTIGAEVEVEAGLGRLSRSLVIKGIYG